MICTGLGNINRGYESFTRECFDKLSEFKDFEIILFKGGGYSGNNEYKLFNLHRNSKLTVILSKIFGKNPYHIEQYSFFISLIPKIISYKPDIIYFSDFHLATLLWHLRKYINLNYKIIYRNGAPHRPPFTRMDHVQHLTPVSLKWALEYGENYEKHTFIPNCININKSINFLSDKEKNLLREDLDLPRGKKIILSAGTINKSHKRMDYVIKEFAEIQNPDLFLQLLGQEDDESKKVKELAENILNPEGYSIKSVSKTEMPDYYKVSDVFVLASLNEAFGRVLLEAMSFGLPCIVHDYDIPRYILQDMGYYADLSKEGSLKELLITILNNEEKIQSKIIRRSKMYERFSWEKLIPEYLDMFYRCC